MYPRKCISIHFPFQSHNGRLPQQFFSCAASPLRGPWPSQPFHSIRNTSRAPNSIYNHHHQHPSQHPNHPIQISSNHHHPFRLPPFQPLRSRPSTRCRKHQHPSTPSHPHSHQSLFIPLTRIRAVVFDTIHRDGVPPLCIISDQFLSWSVEIAKKLGVFHCVLDTSGAYGTAVYISVGIHLPHNKTDRDEFAVPGFPNTYLHRSQLTEQCKNADGTDPASVFLKKQVELTRESDAILVNTVEEMEITALDYLRKNLFKRVWAIGPLLCHPLPSSPSSISCTQWLNLHPPRTVLYISFGSQNSISSTQMMELAKGLEVCGTAFIWIVRPRIGFDVEWVLDGFENRMVEKKQGILVRNWGPQMDILSHRSTGAFLSHCGWNSTLESLSYGVPMIGWPMEAEQFYNSKMLVEELGVAVEMARGCEAEIGGGHVARVVGLVMDGESEKGVEMRRNAERIAEVFKEANVGEQSCEGSSYKAMEEFIQVVVSSKMNS